MKAPDRRCPELPLLLRLRSPRPPGAPPPSRLVPASPAPGTPGPARSGGSCAAGGDLSAKGEPRGGACPLPGWQGQGVCRGPRGPLSSRPTPRAGKQREFVAVAPSWTASRHPEKSSGEARLCTESEGLTPKFRPGHETVYLPRGKPHPGRT